MKMEQIYNIVNDAAKETTGLEAVMNEDLTNVVEFGTAIFNADVAHLFAKNLVNRIGKVDFVELKYDGMAPSVYMDGWQYGSIRQKITFQLPESTVNESWQLQDGVSYDPNVFTESKVSAKYFNGKVTFEVPVSITEEMLKQSFASASDLNALLSGILLYVHNKLTMDTDNLIMRTINNMTATTIKDAQDHPGSLRVVHLLTDFNKKYTKKLTIDNCLSDPEFIKYMALQFKLVPRRMQKMSVLYNIEGEQKFTSPDRLHFIMLDEVKNYADIYLQSEVFHDEYTKMPNAETVPYWQGSGKDYDIKSISKIMVTNEKAGTITQTGVAAVMFDRLALGVTCQNDRTTTNYNGKAEFTNYWFKKDAQYFNDTAENFVAFLLD